MPEGDEKSKTVQGIAQRMKMTPAAVRCAVGVLRALRRVPRDERIDALTLVVQVWACTDGNLDKLTDES